MVLRFTNKRDYSEAKRLLSHVLFCENFMREVSLKEVSPCLREHLIEMKRDYRAELKRVNNEDLPEVIQYDESGEWVTYREWVIDEKLDDWTEGERSDYVKALWEAGQLQTDYSPSGQTYLESNRLIKFPDRGWAYYETWAIDC